MTWTDRDEQRCRGVSPRLVAVMREAFRRWPAPTVPAITEGVRTIQRQRELVAAGKSKTMQSRHIDGMAVDVCLLTPDRKAVDWSAKSYTAFARVVAQVAMEQGVAIRWGGSWRHISGPDCHDYPYVGARFFDGPHFEIPRGYEK